jgi:hypothetical protein
MLDYKLSATVSDSAWKIATALAKIPKSEEEYFAETGAAPETEDTRRRFRRMRVRGRAIIVQGDEKYGVFTIDVSPMGIGFCSPVQLLPKEKISFFCEQSELLQLEVRRCIRTDEQCYNCGAVFLEGPMPPGMYRNLLSDLKE